MHCDAMGRGQLEAVQGIGERHLVRHQRGDVHALGHQPRRIGDLVDEAVLDGSLDQFIEASLKAGL